MTARTTHQPDDLRPFVPGVWVNADGRLVPGERLTPEIRRAVLIGSAILMLMVCGGRSDHHDALARSVIDDLEARRRRKGDETP